MYQTAARTICPFQNFLLHHPSGVDDRRNRENDEDEDEDSLSFIPLFSKIWKMFTSPEDKAEENATSSTTVGELLGRRGRGMTLVDNAISSGTTTARRDRWFAIISNIHLSCWTDVVCVEFPHVPYIFKLRCRQTPERGRASTSTPRSVYIYIFINLVRLIFQPPRRRPPSARASTSTSRLPPTLSSTSR